MAHILYVEDELEIGGWVTRDLTGRGYQVTWLTSGEGAEQYASRADIAVLDVMLPGLDGFSVGKRLKKEAPDLPVLMLSARSSVEDKIEGLGFADDYLTKPFHPDELAARIEVLLRRAQRFEDVLELRHLNVYVKAGRIVDTRNQQEIVLTGKQYHLFQYFLKNLNRILTKEQIYEAVWGEPYIEGDKTLMVHIRHLREKLEIDPAKPEIIETIRGIGYRVRR